MEKRWEDNKEAFHEIHPEISNADLYWVELEDSKREEFLTALEAAMVSRNRRLATQIRRFEYPPLAEQLDMIYHDIDAWRAEIKRVKDKYPKGE